MKVLAVIPTYQVEPLIRERTLDAVAAQTYQHDLVRLEDETPGLAHYDSLLVKLEKARGLALAGAYDALWIVEADVIPPPDALEKLCAVDADVAYGLYCSRHSGMWLCMTDLSAVGGISLSANPPAAKAAYGTVMPSQGFATGCTYIARHVLEAVPFRCPTQRKRMAPDYYFAVDVKAAGFRQAHHLGVVCGHEIAPGVVYWPDPNEDKLYRIEKEPEAAPLPIVPGAYTVTKRLLSNTSGRYITPGETILLDDDTAALLLRRGAVAPLHDTR